MSDFDKLCGVVAGMAIGAVIAYKSETVRSVLRAKERRLMSCLDEMKEDIREKVEPVKNKTVSKVNEAREKVAHAIEPKKSDKK